MSLIMNNGRFVRDQWPAHVPRIYRDTKSVEESAVNTKVPEGYEDLANWAYVRHLPKNIANPYALLYATGNANREGDVTQVSFRVQGYVHSLNLKEMGTWDGSVQNASWARQFIELEGGNSVEPFEAQRRTLKLTRMLIAASTRAPDDHRENAGQIYLHSRVFTKVRAGMREKCVYKPNTAEFEKASQAGRGWVVAHRIRVGRQDEAGKLLHTSPTSIKKGDFVDVQFTADISTYVTDAEELKSRVYFRILRVVQLCTAKTLRKLVAEANAAEAVSLVVEDDMPFDDATDDEADMALDG